MTRHHFLHFLHEEISHQAINAVYLYIQRISMKNTHMYSLKQHTSKLVTTQSLIFLLVL